MVSPSFFDRLDEFAIRPVVLNELRVAFKHPQFIHWTSGKK